MKVDCWIAVKHLLLHENQLMRFPMIRYSPSIYEIATCVLVILGQNANGQIRPFGTHDSGLSQVVGISLSKDQQILAIFGGSSGAGKEANQGEVVLLNSASMKKIANSSGHKSTFTSLAFSEDDSQIATGANDGSVTLWKVKGLQSIITLEGHSHAVRAVFFIGQDSLCTVSTDSLRIWDVKTKKSKVVVAEINEIFVVAVRVPKSQLILIGLRTGEMRLVELGDLSLSKTKIERVHRKVVGKVATNPDQKSLATADGEGKIVLWDYSDWSPTQTLSNGQDDIRCVNYDNTGQLLVTGSEHANVDIWHVQSGKHLLLLDGHKAPITGAVFLSKNEVLSSDAVGKMIRWKLP